jgi:hypothetical protein
MATATLVKGARAYNSVHNAKLPFSLTVKVSEALEFTCNFINSALALKDGLGIKF